MGTFTLIPSVSLWKYNKAEKLSLLKRFMKLMPAGSDSESPDEISLLAETGVPALNISAEQIGQMNGVIARLTEITMRPAAAEETPEMQQVEADRDKAGAMRAADVNAKQLSAEAQNLLDDMCALANASSLLQPSDEAATFVREVSYLFAQVRTAYKQRSKGTAAKPDEPGTNEGGAGGDTDSPIDI